jgi:hypothetical protein
MSLSTVQSARCDVKVRAIPRMTRPEIIPDTAISQFCMASTTSDLTTMTKRLEKKSSSRRISILIGVSVLEICARASSTLLAQPLKHHVAGGQRDLSVPMLHALLEMSSFPISLTAWLLVNRGRISITNWRYRLPMYALMALLDAAR